MTIKNIAKKVIGVLPFGSGVNYLLSDQPMKDSQSKIAMKLIGHGAYALIGIFALSTCIVNVEKAYKQHFEKIGIESMQTKKYNQKLFGENELFSQDLEKAVQGYEAENQ